MVLKMAITSPPPPPHLLKVNPQKAGAAAATLIGTWMSDNW